MFFSTNSRQTFYDWGQYAFLCTRSFKKLKFCSASKKGNNFFRKFCRTYFSNDRQCFSDVSHCGKKEKKGEKIEIRRKKKLASEASREVFWGGERVVPSSTPPQDTAGLASLADIFSYLTTFFAFFPHCGAWSQAIQMVQVVITRNSSWTVELLIE